MHYLKRNYIGVSRYDKCIDHKVMIEYSLSGSCLYLTHSTLLDSYLLYSYLLYSGLLYSTILYNHLKLLGRLARLGQKISQLGFHAVWLDSR